jgi:hypothetical protein
VPQTALRWKLPAGLKNLSVMQTEGIHGMARLSSGNNAKEIDVHLIRSIPIATRRT